MLRLVGERTLFQRTVDRLLPILPIENIIVVTVEEQLDALREQTPKLPQSSFLIEPEGKGTASVIGLGATVLRERYGECIMAALPADHYIENDDRFRESLLAAYEAAAHDYMVTMGISPSYPATGYGYIQRGKPIGNFRDFRAFDVEIFKEKPSLSVAEGYLADGNYAWNSGMFIWKAERILEEIQKQMKELHEGLERISQSLGTKDEQAVMRDVWQGLENQTIDYGIMEKANRVAIIEADGLGWFDIGGWAGLWDVLPEDKHGNIIIAEDVVAIDSKGSLIFQESEGETPRLIAMLGVTDMIIVDMGDALLLCPRDRAEEIRALVKRLEREGKSDLL
jgi:mannose-1-phosphate guanylyltransferase